MKTPMLGAAYTSRSKNLADQRCVCLYPEIIESKTGKEIGALYGTPGLDLLATIPNGVEPVRGLHAALGYLYVLCGNGLYQLTPSFAIQGVGNVLNDGLPVTMVSNETQVAVSSAGSLYCLVVNDVFEQVALPFLGLAGTLVYQDGFAVMNQVGTNVMWQSNLGDLTTWNPLNYDTADGQPDNIIGLGELHRQIYVFKQKHTEVWINNGNPGFVFQRLEGVYMNAGCVAPYSIKTLGEQILWLGQNAQGAGIVYLATGYQPQDMSTEGLVYEWQKYATLADAVAYTYQQSKHSFYVVNFPTANKTWCLDLTASQMFGYPCWHERPYFSNGVYSRALGQNHSYFAGKNVVGDYSSGNLYALDLETLTDNGNPIKRLRSWRAHQGASAASVPYRVLEIDQESGLQVPPGTSPQWVLRYSDDGGHNWSNENYTSAGKSGATSNRARFRRLGMERRGLQSDRIFELSTTDQFKVALLGADINDPS